MPERKSHFGRIGNPARAACADCALVYQSDRWVDVVIPDKIWKIIAPRPGGGGLLCFGCMNQRLLRVGLKNVPALITSGAMAADDVDRARWRGEAQQLEDLVGALKGRQN